MLPPFYRDTTFFLIPYYGNNDNPCYNDTFRKERELSLLPTSTVLTNPSPDEEREIDLGTYVDEEEGDIDDESDVVLDGNDQIDLDLDSEYNGYLESDLLSDTEDRANSAEEFQWSPTLPEQVLSLRIHIY